jgi:hypothetical protein
MVRTPISYIWQLSASNLGPETGYPEGFHGFSQYLQANARIVT